MANNSQSIIVLGMHRSGTSTIARILSEAGVNMGQRLMGANESNPFGHYENRDFVELNDKILKQAGGSWNLPPEMENINILQREFTKEIKECINRNKKHIWGWKDPRSCLTINLFHKYLENPAYIICHRDSSEIAKSLWNREGINIEDGINIANHYKKELANFIKDIKSPILEINFVDLLNEPKKQINIILEFLNINITDKEKERLYSIIQDPKKVHKIMKWEMRKKPFKVFGIKILKAIGIYNYYRKLFKRDQY